MGLPKEDLNFLRALGGPYPVPAGFIQKDLLALEKKSCGGLDGTNALVVGPKQGVFEKSYAGNWNILNQLLELGGRGRFRGLKFQAWLSHRELIRRSSS